MIPSSGYHLPGRDRSAAPGRSQRDPHESQRTAFCRPCYYGTDIDDAENLIANHHTVEEIAEIIGVDSLGYLSVEHLLRSQRDAAASAPPASAAHTHRDRAVGIRIGLNENSAGVQAQGRRPAKPMTLINGGGIRWSAS